MKGWCSSVTRKEILDTACRCVNGDREQDYGSPESNFGFIAEMWSVYLNRKIELSLQHPVSVDELPSLVDSKDVAAMLVLLKIARIASGHAKMDNWVDIAGYAACGGEIEALEAMMNQKPNVEVSENE